MIFWMLKIKKRFLMVLLCSGQGDITSEKKTGTGKAWKNHVCLPNRSQ
jgi:hypothetical protein